ncbi:phage integrase SAM-like domain-containing protein [Bacteroides cellulosilyticus]|uniref:phage integrase SAM-like domain-containing protein n=1 Tax=Bacteroides cellulosilyticus TaxID=246787 RepID=UPI001C37CDA3|nr:phage integrase SAM-like domain-containing protein [Bacteroides cellulosilyticus]MBV3635706.1 site-specific integrase [Bacteroides cellulosilyticus]MBV3662177.1 site-specific integrase [Bacteroides cellulosilyticus]MBV3684298.1 site-specific integrase [Bacteroides cellulosilyticus]MBV3692709.1 site-specific integrase [Bacteroides cellulosilyticus]MBV3706346.1 site-specific integrase [Bacteroides cellulosilyticus]
MLTINPEVVKVQRRTNECFTVRLRFTLNRRMKRISTSLFATSNDLTKDYKIKPSSPIKQDVDALIRGYYDKCAKLQIELNNYTLDDVIDYLNGEHEKNQVIDFIKFSREWIASTTIKGAPNYTTAINALVRFIGKEELDINLITLDFLEGFKAFLNKEREVRTKKLIQQGKRVPSNRSLSLYLISIKKLFNEAKKKYNKQDKNLILIPNSPFIELEIPKQEATRKRAIPVDIIKKVWNLPYKDMKKGYKATCRYNLAKDCFILSFCLMGMNSADLYNATEMEGNTIIYNRTKTKDRRLDKAQMKVDIPKLVLPLIEKYKDKTGKRLFNFYQYYVDEKGFNKAINYGLKEIGVLLEIDDLEYYAARHSWATIALNKVGIDKYTVHAALNHVDDAMKVTDIYIERDFVMENKANAKVMKYVFS